MKKSRFTEEQIIGILRDLSPDYDPVIGRVFSS